MASLSSIFNHFVLPVRLPGRPDENPEAVSTAILARTSKACQLLRKLSSEGEAGTWSTIERSLYSCYGINEKRIDADALLQKWADLQLDDLLILRIAEHNAALLIRLEGRDDEDVIVFEVFETSPCAKDVLAADALLWDFPGRAVEIPLSKFENPSFQYSLATFLEQASEEPLQHFAARTVKAGVNVIENRDTTDPGLIVQFLMPLLEATGHPITVPMIRKRVRDDVHIQQSEQSQLPWRRDPSWLTLRVAVQRQLFFILGYERGRACYKFLICAMLAKLLEDGVGTFAAEISITLRNKLCRRLAKLEMERERAPRDVATLYEELFASVGTFCEKIITASTERVEDAWAHYKRRNTRQIPKLPQRADEKSLMLSLPRSGPYLQHLLNTPQVSRTGYGSILLPPINDGTIKQVRMLADRYFQLARLENEIQFEDISEYETDTLCQNRCVKLAESVTELIQAGHGVYKSKPDQMGVFLLRVFELWASMDKRAVRACPLLGHYHPVFTPDALDVLQLPTMSDMLRLQTIQRYLKSRCDNCVWSTQTIFSDPNSACFAVMYLKNFDVDDEMADLLDEIEDDSHQSRQNKEREWRKACEKYDNLSEEYASKACTCTFDADGQRNINDCRRCFLWRIRNRIKIDIHEDFLPVSATEKAAVVFELIIPRFIQAYRNATWMVFKDLAHPSEPLKSSAPQMLLKNYRQLNPYMLTASHGISLASEKKSFLDTHYRTVKMRADLDDILLPLALEFHYYDQASSVWISDYERPITFQHLCGLHVPQCLTSSVIDMPSHPPATINGPTSYETIASQTKCPPDMSVHDFMALQRLLAGTSRRWMTMLVELGSSNINFSAEDTMYLFNSLVLQAGPAHHTDDVLRDVHIVFNDGLFCQRLAEQVEKRLRTIKPNWRETNCMELLLTIILRIHDLTSGSTRKNAHRLLTLVREATLEWITRLRIEFNHATDESAAKRAATYGFWAALLCRRTFAVFTASKAPLHSNDLCSFIEASIALQENLVVDPTTLPPYLASMLMRDMKLVYHIQGVLRKSITSNLHSLSNALNKTWSGSHDAPGRRRFSGWEFLASPHENWVVATMTSEGSSLVGRSVVHYNFLEGHLFVDGKPLGSLPHQVREAPVVKELFGDQHLRTYPSYLSGMDHQLAYQMAGHEVHFGRRGDDVIIRAVTPNGLMELVPRHVFRGPTDFDLPAELIDDCVHWFNLYHKKLEIRRKPEIWKTRQGDWVFDFYARKAIRRQVVLVDPQSEVCKQIHAIFRNFEDPQHLTVYQPAGGLAVELKRLDLSFSVNRRGLLEIRQMSAEIDPNQDAGTLYGFESKLVLRDTLDSERRSILAKLGFPSYELRGMHVSVCTNGSGYGKFEIDPVLGRLTCPPEPRLLYSKALFHAATSFVLPDPLTGCTGAEEACHLLNSGLYQPWTTIHARNVPLLQAIEQLSPTRVYYPKNMRILQTVRWHAEQTAIIQHDCYRPIIRRILEKSDRLSVFDNQSATSTEDGGISDQHLGHRGEVRRGLYERGLTDASLQIRKHDEVYRPRDRYAASLEAKNVFQTVQLLQQQQFTIPTSINFVEVLRSFPGNFIGGFHAQADGFTGSLSSGIDNGLEEQWGSLVNFCRMTNPEGIHKAMFRLGLLSFSEKQDMAAVRLLCGFVLAGDLKRLEPPPCASFEGFKDYMPPSVEHISKFICTEDAIIKTARGRTPKTSEISRRRTERVSLAKFLLKQWPTAAPSFEKFEPSFLDIDEVMENVGNEWSRLYSNALLLSYANEVQAILAHYAGAIEISKPSQWQARPDTCYKTAREDLLPSFSQELLLKSMPSFPESTAIVSNENLRIPQMGFQANTKLPLNGETSCNEIHELECILSSFVKSPKPLWRQYGADLLESVAALHNVKAQGKEQVNEPSMDEVFQQIRTTRNTLHKHLTYLRMTLSGNDARLRWLELATMGPRITTVTALEQLRSSSHCKFGKGMKEFIIRYGVIVTSLQRLLRIRKEQMKRDWVYDPEKMKEQCRDTGHTNWNPMEYPDWLLLEIESNLLIRPEQVDVAKAIISPQSGSNSVLQLNMGKGKTSCIVPMAVAVLADTKSICRLIIPKALLLQTAQTLQSRIGGLVGRELRHVPFSRRTPTTMDMLKLYNDHHTSIMRSSGIILAIPEHILSYKLSGFQRLADAKLPEARTMLKTQSQLTEVCRDVLDESDFTLAVKTQLIYPSGQLLPLDGHPSRWIVAQNLLSLVQDHLSQLHKRFPRGIDVVERPQGFPVIHIIHADIEDALRKALVKSICDGGTSIVKLQYSSPPTLRQEIERILTEEDLESEVFERVSKMLTAKSSFYKNILLVRGLLVTRILFLCLKKRWNVQYGLHPTRVPIAVPYEAKGAPSEQAEFGHPDVAILFTCLAFYYSGLTLSQLQEGLGHVLRSDDPASEYDQWISGSRSLPDSLQHWNVINVDDIGQVEELWKHLRYDQNVLNHYMNVFVFPAHAKQFNVKLQSSGWDIPLFSLDAKKDLARTTGFSGTNDNRRLLPLTIRQDDLPSLSQTNAEVITYLLQSRNRRYMVAIDPTQRRLTEEGLLAMLTKEKIRILVDAGACILEMPNKALIKTWLKIDHAAQAAVYFDENKAWVQYRKGRDPVPLLATPFADNLEGCLVYLDEAHTRGTDLKFPREARGAVTLALGQTKDHTVQGKSHGCIIGMIADQIAAMRLRQLATSQSVVFVAPPEVDQSIRDVCKPKKSETIDSSHVVRWLLEQTCRGNEQLQGLYASQGFEFCRRTNALLQYPKFAMDNAQGQALLKVHRSPEQLTLQQLYGPSLHNDRRDLVEISHVKLRKIVKELSNQRQSTDGISAGLKSAMEEVEQEREVEYQVEEVREVQKPTHYEALKFKKLHPVISRFVATGILSGQEGYEHAFSCLGHTCLGTQWKLQATGSRLFVSAEFRRTVDLGPHRTDDNYFRPVEWVLWSHTTQTALVVIPEEAEKLIPVIRDFKESQVQLIVYAAPTTKNMRHFNSLSYYSLPHREAGSLIPKWLSAELGILGARLYFNLNEYTDLTKYLRLASGGDTVSGGIDHDSGDTAAIPVESLAEFLMEWLSIRRKGQDIAQTPMGYVCQGKPLDGSHPFFAEAQDNGNEIDAVLAARIATLTTEDAVKDADSESSDSEDSD